MTTSASTRFTGWVLGAATVAMGLAAGSFYVFACGVMPGLARADDRTYIEAMQGINAAIQNPVFFLSFVGALVCTGYAAWRVRRRQAVRGWVFAALVGYALVFVLTSAVNVPLNDTLAAAGTPARIADPSRVREHFESPWVTWNAVRAALSAAALGCLVRGLVVWGHATRG
ncbi:MULTISPECIES: DUF1772 domain-containing protein [unclassified Streptomyces]|uniref:anthrone oxygenase family protein n=1 Tax=unclassified Streptomyces TaxID=2593676 RepID=UPI00278BBE80|nr:MULTISPECIES: anthrone oxygenase family protein [unclassified Streptomyces]